MVGLRIEFIWILLRKRHKIEKRKDEIILYNYCVRWLARIGNKLNFFRNYNFQNFLLKFDIY